MGGSLAREQKDLSQQLTCITFNATAEQVTQKERVYIVPTGTACYGFNLTHETEFFSCSETYSHQLDGYSG